MERLRVLHAVGFVHNDLKLENMVIGRDDPNEIYLIDFGLTRRYLDNETKEHLEKKKMHVFQGNFKFATKK